MRGAQTRSPLETEQFAAQSTLRTPQVHYGGGAADMDAVMDVARSNGLAVVEDAAQGIFARFRGRALGSIGRLGAFSFHETKNLSCGEGGALVVNDPELIERAEVIQEKGT